MRISKEKSHPSADTLAGLHGSFHCAGPWEDLIWGLCSGLVTHVQEGRTQTETGQQRAAAMTGKPESGQRARPRGTDEQRYDRSPQTQERERRGQESCSGSGTMLAQEQTQANTFRLKSRESCYYHSEFWASFLMGIQKAAKIVLGCSSISHEVVFCGNSEVLSPSRKVLQHVLPRAQTQQSIPSQKYRVSSCSV